MVFQGEAIGDFVIVRSNGIPAYNFAVVVDDHAMEISHVIRGEDHLSNTASQILLYHALGYTPPIFAHHGLVLGKDRAKLSKRHGATSVGAFRRRGILPEALLNYLALLGSSWEGGREVASAVEISAGFAMERIGKGGAVFDEDKLLWLNGLYLRRLPPAALVERLIPFLPEAGYDRDSFGPERLTGIATAVQDSLSALADIGGCLEIFSDDRFRIDAEAETLLRSGEAKPVITALQQILDTGNAGGDLSTMKSATPSEMAAAGDAGRRQEAPIPFASLVKRISEQTGLKGKKLYLPLRAVLTGRLHGPELERIFALLDRTSLRRRAEKALAL
jgi:nondiscriminating glutamyl-tRNA synthetase